MQLQMETCNLNECDFLETRLKEYESREEFDNDGTFQYTSDGNYKGVMVFMKNDKPHYEYAPFNCTKRHLKNGRKNYEKNSNYS